MGAECKCQVNNLELSHVCRLQWTERTLRCRETKQEALRRQEEKALTVTVTPRGGRDERERLPGDTSGRAQWLMGMRKPTKNCYYCYYQAHQSLLKHPDLQDIVCALLHYKKMKMSQMTNVNKMSLLSVSPLNPGLHPSSSGLDKLEENVEVPFWLQEGAVTTLRKPAPFCPCWDVPSHPTFLAKANQVSVTRPIHPKGTLIQHSANATAAICGTDSPPTEQPSLSSGSRCPCWEREEGRIQMATSFNSRPNFPTLVSGATKPERPDRSRVPASGPPGPGAASGIPAMSGARRRLLPAPTAASAGIFRRGGPRALRRTGSTRGRPRPARFPGRKASAASGPRGRDRCECECVRGSVCEGECARECAGVCKCLSVCLCGDSGAGGSGSPGGGAAAAAAARAPALLAAQVRSARHFVRFTKSSSGRSRRQQPPLGARPRRRRPLCRAGPRGPAAGNRGPGTAVFAGEGAVASPAPGAAGTASRGETEQAAARPGAGAPGAERGCRGGAGCGGRGGSGSASAAREPEAETHRRKRRERPAIVPLTTLRLLSFSCKSS
ncbi:PREDICTED: collagen alpha-1(I) chain-like [Cercocebus atys]|uniref:collagen alpha-1(I) chain-like n=1 Tax=Cercocebus atys TaxID=9531 RepID=UPI0005F586B0|nr:PREDICTED: collagen alpha-1(I) chain-like [Cercocebus atys]